MLIDNYEIKVRANNNSYLARYFSVPSCQLVAWAALTSGFTAGIVGHYRFKIRWLPLVFVGAVTTLSFAFFLNWVNTVTVQGQSYRIIASPWRLNLNLQNGLQVEVQETAHTFRRHIQIQIG